MKNYITISDIGSVLVGDENFRVALPNIGGDGHTTLVVYDINEPVPEAIRRKFVTCIEGVFNVYKYDCSGGSPDDVIARLSGRYGVYQDEMKVILQKWED